MRTAGPAGRRGCRQLPFLLSSISAMKLSDWARKQGIGIPTAWRWLRAGHLPFGPHGQLLAGTIRKAARGSSYRRL